MTDVPVASERHPCTSFWMLLAVHRASYVRFHTRTTARATPWHAMQLLCTETLCPMYSAGIASQTVSMLMMDYA